MQSFISLDLTVSQMTNFRPFQTKKSLHTRSLSLVKLAENLSRVENTVGKVEIAC